MLHLGSYVDFDAKSAQFEWLVEDLKSFSRARTPWLIANFHAPWYHTYIAVRAHMHTKVEADCKNQTTTFKSRGSTPAGKLVHDC